MALISNEGGGISAVSKGIGTSLSKRKIYTTIFTGATRSNPRSERLNEYLKIVYLPNLDFPPRTIWFQAQNIKKIFRDFDCSVIHGVSPDASFALTFLKKQLAKPYVATIHDPIRTRQRDFVNQPFNSWTVREFSYFVLEYPLNFYAIRRALQDSDHATFCSYAVQRDIETCISLDYTRTSVIYNGVNFDEIDGLKISQDENKTDISIVYAGRLYWSKGAMFLLHAFDRLKNDLKNVRLQIFGRGPLESRIDSFISKSGLTGRVTRVGYVPRTQLISEMKKSDIVVFPSLSEAQSIFMLEAMACKKPLIAFDLPFAREVLSNMKTGLLTKPGDIADLSEAIKLLARDEKLRLRLGEAAYDNVKKNHDWDKQTELYLEVYEKAINHFKIHGGP